MALSMDRPGVFEGRRFETFSWYVIDPSFQGYEGEVKAEWERIASPSNLSRVARITRFLSWGGTILLVALVLRFAVGLNHFVALGLGIAAAVVVNTAVALAVRWRWSNRLRSTEFEDELTSVVPIVPAIAEWATDATAWPILWELNLELVRLGEIDHKRAAWIATSGRYARAESSAQSDRVAAELEVQLADQRSRFVEVARWSGFDPTLVLLDEVQPD